MSYESQLKSNYAGAHRRLITPNYSPKKVLKLIPKIEPPPAKIEVIPNSSPVILEPPKPRYSLAMLAEWLSEMELIGVADIRSAQRTKEIALSRMIFYHLAYKHSSRRFSSMQIGRYCKKDHTSVLSGIKSIAERRKTDKQLNFRLNEYEKALITQSLEVKGKTLCVLCPHRYPQSSTCGGQ